MKLESHPNRWLKRYKDFSLIQQLERLQLEGLFDLQ